MFRICGLAADCVARYGAAFPAIRDQVYANLVMTVDQVENEFGDRGQDQGDCFVKG